jgi:hypothetical protein
MRRRVFVCLVFWLLASAAPICRHGGGVLPLVGITLANAQASGTELMQQSDHQRRVERAKKAEAEERQIAAFGMPEAASRDYDVVVLIMLAASVVILAVIASRRSHPRPRL